MEAPRQDETSPKERVDIAVVGMACRFPGARSLEQYWANLARGTESIRTLSDAELLAAGVPRRDLDDPEYVKRCPVLEDIDKFDAAFFGLSPRDASVMDPAHRFFLEVAWQALENSGNTGLHREGRVGVYAGSGAPLYWMNNVRTHKDIMSAMGEFLVRHTSNDMNFLATLASYQFDLRGPSINVQTACSSALVCAHLARESLIRGECDMAIVGGSTIVLPMGHGYHYKEGEILSPDGHCRPFDHRSAGTVFGSGTGCLVLKRSNDALDNGDTIHAVIKGSAINNDGSVKVGFLAPSFDGQAEVIRAALASAGVSAESISYVETHGTGTSVGDPIELTALEQAFAEQTAKKQFCGIGSVKSNIGHLGEAAAAASLIKAILALQHRRIPPTLGYERPNPRFDLENSPFYVNATLREWNSDGPLRCGITALGAGGTNCHLILEEAPAALPGEGAKERQLLVLSAKSKSALERMSANLASHLEAQPTADLADVAYTLCLGRRALAYRRVLVAKDCAEASALLRGAEPARVATAVADASDPTIVFTFPGGGAQYARMGFDLYAGEPVFRETLDQCLAVIDVELGRDLRPLLFASVADAEKATVELQRPSLALPTLFAVEYALARFFESLGLRPAAFIGHSMGEYVAACLAGVFSLRDGLRLVILRGRLFESAERGRMVGVSLSETETRALMPAGLGIAAVNAPELCVASGPAHLVEELQRTLTGKDIDWTPIHIDVAAHSSLLDPILGQFREIFRTISLRAPEKPIASNLTGRWLTASEATDPEYWVKHLRSTVRFADCVETVLEAGNRVFLEIGPGRTLTTLVAAQKTKVSSPVNSVRHPRESANDVDYALLTLGRVWAAGAAVDWTILFDEQLRNRIPLPVYPFEAQSYWIAPAKGSSASVDELVKRENLDDWFATVAWDLTPLAAPPDEPAKSWLCFVDNEALGQALAARLGGDTHPASKFVIVRAACELRRVNAATWEIDPCAASDYQRLFETLEREGALPDHVIYMLGVNAEEEDEAGSRSSSGLIGRWKRLTSRESQGTRGHDESGLVEKRVARHFFGPVYLAKAIGAVLDKCQFTIVTSGAFAISDETLDPLRRLSSGPAQVIPRELPDVRTRLVDLEIGAPSGPGFEHALDQLARELGSSSTESPVALRAPRRFSRRVRSMALPPAGAPTTCVSDDDAVFITGGLGGIGLVVAEHLARARPVKLALLSRGRFPERSTWASLLAAQDTPALVRHRIESVRGLEALGARVLCVDGDVVDENSLSRALTRVRAELGPIQVVIHAAGVMDDEPFQTKTDASMQRVLAPKVQGTLNLDWLITEDVRAFVLMSSVASVLGLPGQIDYTAANAFLDAFAEEREARKPGRTLVINWNAWRDVGMIVAFEARGSTGSLPVGRGVHPWLQAFEPTDHGRRYFTDFDVKSQWLVAEHRIRNADALIPGTGFVELARAAAAEMFAAQPGAAAPSATCFELSGVVFQLPFQVTGDRSRRIQIELEALGDGYSVTMTTAGHPEVHMTAHVTRCADEDAPLAALATIRARCSRSESPEGGFLDQRFVDFGPRWANLRAIHYGNREALVELTLPAAFADDLALHAYHPALMDMATGAAQPLIPGFRKESDFFVPFGYDRIRIFQAPTASCFSHVVLRAETAGEIASFDVTLLDPVGRRLIAIEGFTMKRVGTGDSITSGTSVAGAARAERGNAAVAALLRDAITPAEGVIAFDRALAQREAVQVIASSVDVNVWRAQLDAESRRQREGEGAEVSAGFARPALSTEYSAPASPGEIELATIWSRLLGVSAVGVLDDFFELGGNSLSAVRLFARMKKQFAVSLPLSTLFQAPTIRGLVGALREQGWVEPRIATSNGVPLAEPATEMPLGPLPALGAKRIDPPVPIRAGAGRLPIFLVHDGLGETLLYRTLALQLTPGHPVYGLQPEQNDDGTFAHTRIREMASAKIERIRTVQPSGPYLVAGLCAGGVIAFEIARQLEDAGEQVLFVGLLDAADVAAEERKFRVAQERLERVLGVFKAPESESTLKHLAGAVPKLIGKTANMARYEFEMKLERLRSARAVKQMREQESVATPADATTPEIAFLKLYELAHKEHVPTGVLRGGDVVLFRATHGDGTPPDVPFREVYSDELMGWQCRVDGAVQGVDVPGGHSSLLQEPHVRGLAREMQRCIDGAIEKGTRLSSETSTSLSA